MGVDTCFEFANEAAKTQLIDWDKAVHKNSLNGYFGMDEVYSDEEYSDDEFEGGETDGAKAADDKGKSAGEPEKTTHPTTFEVFAKAIHYNKFLGYLEREQAELLNSLQPISSEVATETPRLYLRTDDTDTLWCFHFTQSSVIVGSFCPGETATKAYVKGRLASAAPPKGTSLDDYKYELRDEYRRSVCEEHEAHCVARSSDASKPSLVDEVTRAERRTGRGAMTSRGGVMFQGWDYLTYINLFEHQSKVLNAFDKMGPDMQKAILMKMFGF
ncbi:hypothetical protein HK097_002641 [Rhizophlyctis rosea]|uniref:Uncharacterized protein n=1 Tax=Rhizophlyctis rosea TaxID=64517 RepID=A0AAD5SGG5_9FUNG|nr:hypothetical protein HK097_002641 [Rhizophlyctis rosea]